MVAAGGGRRGGLVKPCVLPEGRARQQVKRANGGGSVAGWPAPHQKCGFSGPGATIKQDATGKVRLSVGAAASSSTEAQGSRRPRARRPDPPPAPPASARHRAAAAGRRATSRTDKSSRSRHSRRSTRLGAERRLSSTHGPSYRHATPSHSSRRAVSPTPRRELGLQRRRPPWRLNSAASAGRDAPSMLSWSDAGRPSSNPARFSRTVYRNAARVFLFRFGRRPVAPLCEALRPATPPAWRGRPRGSSPREVTRDPRRGSFG